MNNYELHEEAETLTETFPRYALAMMYLQKCGETDKAMTENRHLQGEIEKYKQMLQECEMENEDFRRDNLEYRRQISSMRGV